MIHQIGQKQNTPKIDDVFKYKLCCGDLPGFYTLREPKNTQPCFPIERKNVHLEHISNEVIDTHLREELRPCHDSL